MGLSTSKYHGSMLLPTHPRSRRSISDVCKHVIGSSKAGAPRRCPACGASSTRVPDPPACIFARPAPLGTARHPILDLQYIATAL